MAGAGPGDMAAYKAKAGSDESSRFYYDKLCTAQFFVYNHLPRVTATNAVAALYIDRDHSADASPQPGDYRFSIRIRGTGEADEGDGKGGGDGRLPDASLLIRYDDDLGHERYRFFQS